MVLTQTSKSGEREFNGYFPVFWEQPRNFTCNSDDIPLY